MLRRVLISLALLLLPLVMPGAARNASSLPEPSAVLRAMYPDEAFRARSALRLSFGPETRESDLQFAIDALRRVLARLRGGASLA